MCYSVFTVLFRLTTAFTATSQPGDQPTMLSVAECRRLLPTKCGQWMDHTTMLHYRADEAAFGCWQSFNIQLEVVTGEVVAVHSHRSRSWPWWPAWLGLWWCDWKYLVRMCQAWKEAPGQYWAGRILRQTTYLPIWPSMTYDAVKCHITVV